MPMPGMLRELDELELKILRTIAAHKPTNANLGCHQDAIEAAMLPHPFMQRLASLHQDKVVAPKLTPKLTRRDKEWELTEMGRKILDWYADPAHKPEKVKPLMSRRELMRKDAAADEAKQLPLSVVDGDAPGTGPNYAAMEPGARTVTGKAAAPHQGQRRSSSGRIR